MLDSVSLHDAKPELRAALVEIGFDTGTHETYQLLTSGKELDALADPRHVRELVHMIRGGVTVQAEEGMLEFRPLEGFAGLGTELTSARVITAEQSNTSIVFDDELILKVFRRLEAGVNPELELLRFLTERDFPNIAQLGGWYAYLGRPMDATLGVLQQFVRNGVDGWELALDELGDDPERFITRLHELGGVIGRMHTVLASDLSDPAFAPEEPTDETLALLTATVDEEIERLFIDLPHVPEVAPIDGRGEEVRDRLRMLAGVGARGKLIRHHGDLHLGQTLLSGEGDDTEWIILDFEGEPARSLLERRRKRSGLRDVAGMLRSFAYVASASDIQRGRPAPEGWEDRAREAFLAGYLDTVDPSLLPPGGANTRRLLSVYELEKAVYELRYELNNRPDWVRIPVAGIARLLEEPIA